MGRLPLTGGLSLRTIEAVATGLGQPQFVAIGDETEEVGRVSPRLRVRPVGQLISITKLLSYTKLTVAQHSHTFDLVQCTLAGGRYFGERSRRSSDRDTVVKRSNLVAVNSDCSEPHAPQSSVFTNWPLDQTLCGPASAGRDRRPDFRRIGLCKRARCARAVHLQSADCGARNQDAPG
jgi:hypothetical protein